VFCGFPGVYPDSKDIARQLVIILHLWNQFNLFPIEFEPLHMGSQVKDDTVTYIESINESATHFVQQIYIAI
jgi:hypothetical protein